MLVVDTNVLVYAADDAAPEQAACRGFLERLYEGQAPWYLTWNVIYEFLRVVTHTRVMAAPRTIAEAWTFVAALLAAPSCGVLVATSRHSEVAAQLFEEHRAVLAGNLLHDAQTVVLMHEHGISRIVTRDADFHRFARLEVVDPLAAT